MTQGGNLELYRRIVEYEPLTKKAIFKKNDDTFKNWLSIVDENGEKAPKEVLSLINIFDKKTKFPQLLFDSGINANTYGTGFIEKQYREHKNTKAKSDATGKKLIDLEILSSEYIKNTETIDGVRYPVYKKKMEEKVYIHPSRLEVVRIDNIGNNYFGLPIPKLLWNTLQSKMNSDLSSGEILEFAAGMFDLTIQDMDDEQETKAETKFGEHPKYLIHDQDYELKAETPNRIDPKSFYDYFYVNIASAMNMPKHMLIGAEMGNVTGTEVGTSAYYSDIENIQKRVFTPIVESIYSELLESNGMTWKYFIDWNPIFVDELSEAKILQTRAYSAVQAFNAGIIDEGEARKMLMEGVIDLELDKKIKKETPGGAKPSDPNVNPQPVIKPQSLTDEQKKMIKNWKDYCKREELAQEERLKEAKKKEKK